MDAAFSARTAADAAPASARVRVAATVDYYLPGYKAGGALRTMAHMAEQLADGIEFHVVTRDRDFTDTVPYPRIVPGGWTEVGGTAVRYLAPEELRARAVGRALRQARPRVLYFNSAFSPVFTVGPLLLRRAGRLPRVAVIVAPRGELSEGALATRRGKKLAFLRMARAAGLYRGVLWQASSEAEAEEVRRWFGAGARVAVAPDLRERPEPARPPAPKRPGALRAVFLSRIAEKKNLLGALDLLDGVAGDVSLTVFGPVDDVPYWEACRARIAALPSNVRVDYAGTLRREEVGDALARHHLFLFPTLGENFGHVVLEALLAGLPVLTSDRTPWGGIEPAGAGWALPLEDADRLRAVLQGHVDAGDEEHARRSAAARAFGESVAADPRVRDANLALFRRAVEEGR